MKKGGRHETACRVCNHPNRKEIEEQWCAWANTTQLAKDHGLSRDSIYRHVAVFNLREKRARNLRAALERIIENADTVPVNAAAVVSAITAYAKINAQGAWVDRIERIDLNDMFERMTARELETYAKSGTLPQWFTDVIGATPSNSQEGQENGQIQ
jgi:hypothetical protein